MPGLCNLITQTYLGKFTKGLLFTPHGSEIAAKRRGPGGVILPFPGKVVRVK